MIVAFPTFMDAVRCGYAIALADGIVKKLISPIAWPAPDAFRQVREHCPDGQAILIAMIAEPSVAAFKSVLSQRHKTGTITFEQPTADEPGDVPLYEFTWNHTTLQMLKRDRSVTYLQALHPAASVAGQRRRDRSFVRGRTDPASGVPACRRPGHRQRPADRALHHRGAAERDHRRTSKPRRVDRRPHVFTLEDGAGHKQINADQLSLQASCRPARVTQSRKDAQLRGPSLNRPGPVRTGPRWGASLPPRNNVIPRDLGFVVLLRTAPAAGAA